MTLLEHSRTLQAQQALAQQQNEQIETLQRQVQTELPELKASLTKLNQQVSVTVLPPLAPII